jgi:hypothetical protein
VQLYNDYFHPETALYRNYFRCRFRILRKLFGRTIEGVCYQDPFFKCKSDVTVKLDFSSYRKYSVGVRMLAYGFVSDPVDEYYKRNSKRND